LYSDDQNFQIDAASGNALVAELIDVISRQSRNRSTTSKKIARRKTPPFDWWME